MGDDRKITGRRIVFVGVLVFLIGFIFVYGPSIYHYIQTGELPETKFGLVALGNIFMIVGPWIIKGRTLVKRAVN